VPSEQTVDWDKAITRVLDGEQDIPIMRANSCLLPAARRCSSRMRETKSRRMVTTILDGEMAA